MEPRYKPLSLPDTTSLLLLKVLVGYKKRTHHIIQTTVLAEGSPDSTHFVTKMEQLGSGPDAHIYIGTETDLYRVPVQSCSSHSTCCQCVAARDPYCAYDTSAGYCVPFRTGHTHHLQNLRLRDRDAMTCMGVCPRGVAPATMATRASASPRHVQTTESEELDSDKAMTNTSAEGKDGTGSSQHGVICTFS